MFKKISAVVLSYVLMTSSVFGAMITPDGKTNTTVSVNGNVSDVHTGTVSGQTGFNSFSTFDVYQGHTANLYLPEGTKNLINLVHDKISNIDGVLNAFKDGKIGGNVFFLNPNGIAVGASGVINVGALTLATPTKEFMDNVISSDRAVSSQLTKAILAGDMPLNPLGLISIKGKINASGGVGLMGGDILNRGDIRTNFEVSDIVNLEDKNLESEVLVKDGRVLIVSKNNFVNEGSIRADGSNGKNASEVNIKAGGDIALNSGVISASGEGEDSSGGKLLLWADGKSFFNKGASLLAKGGKSGDGGFIEFSAGKLVDLAGGLFDASSYFGKRGSVFIDPKDIVISEDFLSSGADYNLTADNSITLKEGKKISTSKAGAASGNVSLTAKDILLENNSSIDASAAAGQTAGDITLTAKDFSDGYMVKNNSASVTLGEGVSLKGKNITVTSTADNTRLFDDDSTAATVGEHTIGELGDTTLLGGAIVSDVDSEIIIGKNSKIEAFGDVNIETLGKANGAMRAIGTAVAAVYGESDVYSNLNVREGAEINAGGKVNLSAKTDSSLNVSSYAISTVNTPVPGDGALSIGKMTVNNNVVLDAGAKVSGSEVSVEAVTDKEMSVTASTMAFDDGYASLSVTYSKSDVHNGVDAGGDITSSGKTLINSRINSTGNKTSAGAGTGSSTVMTPILKGLHFAHDKIASWLKKKNVQTNNQSNVKIGLSAALSYSDQNNTSTAKAGGTIKSGADLDVTSTVTDAIIRQSASGSVDSKAGAHEKENAAAGSVGIASYNNTSTAYIAEGAVVDARGPLTVASSVSVPFEITWHKIEGVGDVVNKINSNGGLQNGFFTTWAKSDLSTNDGEEVGKLGLAGAVNIADFNSSSRAYIGKNAQINKNADYKNGAQSVNVTSGVDVSTLNMAGIWGVTGVGTKSKVGLGGSYQQIGYESNSSAEILSGADVETNNLSVTSDVDQRNISIAEAGGKSETFGFDGAFDWLKSDTSSKAFVAKDAKVKVEGTGGDKDKALISAKDNMDMFNIAGGVVKTQNVGIGTSVSISDITRNTQAFIGDIYDASQPTARTENGYFKSDKNIEISAENSGDIYAYSLAGVLQNDKKEASPEEGAAAASGGSEAAGGGGKFGVGISGDVSYNNIEGAAKAYINAAKVEAAKNLNIAAKESSWINSVAGAASLVLGQGTSVGFAGSASTNFVRNDASAFINNGDVSMLTQTAVAKDSSSKPIVTGGGKLDISSVSEAEIIAVAASGSLANPASKGGSLAGSVTVNDIGNEVSSFVKASNINSYASSLTKAVNLSASDFSKIVSVAGALGVAGTVGIGSSTGVNEISNTVKAYLEDSSLTAQKDVSLDAQNSSTLTNVEGTVGAAKDGMAVAASVAVNEIGNTASSYIKGGTTTVSDGSLSVLAKDTSNMTAVAGEISGAGKAAVGASTAVSNIKNKVYSYADGALIDVGGNADFKSDLGYTLKTAAAGGAGSEYASVTGSAAVNNIDTDTQAYITASSMTAGGSAGFRAASENEINFYGGTLDGAAGAGIGGTVVVNNVSDKAYAGVRGGSSLDVYGKTALSGELGKGLFVTSSVNDDLNSWMFNLSGGGFGFAANVDVANIKNSSQAEILNSYINQNAAPQGTDLSGQNILVKAVNKADAESYGGSLAGGGAGVGAVSDTILFNNITKAGIENSTLSAKGYIKALTDSLERYNAILVSGGVGGSLGLAGNVAVASLNNLNEAYIKKGQILSEDNVEAVASDIVELGRKDGEDFAVAVGALAGGSAGIGGSVLVSNVKNNTKAFIADSTVDAARTLKVRATGKQDIVSYLPTAALAASGGISASVGVNTIDSSAEAYIYESENGQTVINGDSSKASALQDVEVSAESDSRIHTTIAAGSAAGGAGVGAGIGVSTINGKTSAGIGAGSEVNAGRNIKIESVNTRKTDDLAVSAAAGGIGAANGSILVSNIGSNLDADSKEATEGVRGAVNEQLAANSNITKETFGRGGLLDSTAEQMQAFTADVNEAFTDKVLDDKGTSAFVGANAKINAGGKTDISADDYIKTDLTAGGASLASMASVGASVAVANSSSSTKAFIGDNAEVTSLGGLDVKASSEVLESDVKAILGSGSVSYALGAAVAKVNSNNNTLAYLSDYVRVNNSGAVNVNAASKADINVQTVGAVLGGAAAVGASVAGIDKKGSTSAFTGDSVTVDNAESFKIKASTESDISAEAEAGSGGVAAGTGTDADAVINDKILAATGDKAIIRTSGETSVITEGSAKAVSKTYGVDAGALTVGVSLADSVINLDNKAEIGRENIIGAGDVKLAAEQKKAETLADAFAASGALIGGAGATSSSRVNGSVLANIRSKSDITSAGGVTFKSKSYTDQTSKSTYYGGAVISAGVNEADVEAEVDVKTVLNDGLKINAGSFEASSDGADKLYAKAVSGSGGALAASAALVRSDNNSVSKVEIGQTEKEDAGAVLNNNINADTVLFKAVNSTLQDSEVDSRNGGIIHAGGASAKNNSDMTVAVDFKDRTSGKTYVNASDFKAEALNNYAKNLVDGQNVYSGSGGAIEVPITESITKINNYTDVTFGDNTKVDVRADSEGSSSFLVNAINNIKGDDKVLLKSGGLVIVPVVTSEITNDNNKAAIIVKSAELNSANDIVFNAKADVDISAGSDLNIYGGVSVAAGKSLAKTNVLNEINLRKGAKLSSGGDVYFTLSQPKTESGSAFDNTGRSYIKASGVTNVWNATALAFNADSAAKGDIYVNNNVNVDSGALVRSGRNININGVKALTSATGLLDLTSPLGDLAASSKSTSVKTEQKTNVKIDGELFAGVNNTVKLSIDGNRNITVNGGELPGYTIASERLSENILNEIEKFRILKAQYSVSEVSAAAYQAEINRLESELAALGQIDENGLMTEVPVDFIVFDDIRANMGDISINADNITGAGKLSAPGSAEVEINNNSDLFMRFNDVAIDSSSTGSIYYNGALVKSAQDIASANADYKTASLSEVVSSGGLENGRPSIKIKSSYSYQNRAPNLEFLGDILNDNGDINVYSSGSIQAKGNMRAKNISMEAADKIMQSYVSDSFLHVAGNPYGYWGDVASSSESGKTDTSLEGSARGGGTSISGNNVFLSAAYLDINGLVQSGSKDLTLNIGDNFTLSADGRTFNSIEAAAADYYARKNRHEANVSELYAINDSGNIQAYFNVLENRIELKDVKVDGGRLELFGHILNTGGNYGELKVLDGFGRINVANNSSYDLFLNSLDASSKVEGTIKITDTAQKDATGGFLETVYYRSGDTLLTVNSNTRDADGNANNIVSRIEGGRETSYNPLSGQRYYWNTGKEKIKETTYKKESNSFWGMDFLVPDDSYELTNTRYLQDNSLYEGEFVKTGEDSSKAYTYTFEDKDVVLLDNEGKPVVDANGNPVPYKTYDKRWTTTSGWWIFSSKTNHHEVKYEEGHKEINTHSVKADYPVKITFDGYDSSSLDINSSKSNIILNGLLNNASGDVNITASGGAVKSNSADAYIKAQNVNITAKNGVGGQNAVNVELTGGAVNVSSETGDINLASVMASDFVFGNISGAGGVNIKSERSVYGKDASSLIKGDGVTLQAAMGSIGKDGLAVNLDTNHLSASAQESVAVKNASSGDLGINLIESKSGDVDLETAGGIYDENKNEVIDQRSKEELLKDWSALGLMDEDGAGWTEDQLTYKIDAASLDNKVNTQYMVEDPNIKGANVRVKAGGAIGQDNGGETFNIADFKNLSDEKKLLISSAERDNIVFSEDGQTLTVLKREDVDIHADRIDLNASGFIYLGAEQDINVGSIDSAGNNITIMGAGGIYNVLEEEGVNIKGGNLTLEASEGAIGSGEKALSADISGKLNARALDGVWLSSPGNLAVDYIFTEGLADIKTSGTVTDARGDDLPNIRAYGINIEAAEAGSEEQALGVALEQGGDGINALNVKTSGSAYIEGAGKEPLYIAGFTSGGDIKIASKSNILNASAQSLIKAGGDMTFACENCNIGEESSYLNLDASGLINAFGDDIHINSKGSASVLGKVVAEKDVNVLASVSDLVLNNVVSAENGSAVLESASNIFSGAKGYVAAHDINLTAQSGSIGTEENPLKIEGSSLWEDSSLTAKAEKGIYLTGFANGLKIDSLTVNAGDVSVITDEDIKVNDLGGVANITADNITLHSNKGTVGEADLPVVVDVNEEGGLVNVIGAEGIYLAQLRHTFNSDYIKNTESGDIYLKVPFNDVNIKEVQKQDGFNVVFGVNDHLNDIGIAGRNVKNLINDPVYMHFPINELPARLKIFEREKWPYVGYDDEPARMM